MQPNPDLLFILHIALIIIACIVEPLAPPQVLHVSTLAQKSWYPCDLELIRFLALSHIKNGHQVALFVKKDNISGLSLLLWVQSTQKPIRRSYFHADAVTCLLLCCHLCQVVFASSRASGDTSLWALVSDKFCFLCGATCP